MADQTGPPFFKCIWSMCWYYTNDSDTVPSEALSDYITPDTVILVNLWRNFGSRNGDITLYSEHHRLRHSSAVLGTTIIRDPDDKFLRFIEDPDGGFSWMQVERPVTDPDTSCGSLDRDPLLANTPEGLRSAVDPVSLLSSFNKSCDVVPGKCLVSMAVRPKI